MRSRKMTELDLHGLKHEEVEDKLANLLILHYNMNNFPVKIITGKSDKMKKIVRRIVKEHGFTEDDFWNDNPGTIILRS